MQYTIQYFIDKFEAIPEDLWYVGDFSNLGGTKHCALAPYLRQL